MPERTIQKKLSFNFGWLALKLMGKSLYSNAWSAISELVANGFDANAKDVYVFVDASNKKNATIEIIDNGDGMTTKDMSTYRQVGFNKREDYKKKHKVGSAPVSIMGRKGIGKLAALYLSSIYYICTKPKEGPATCWKMDFPKEARSDNVKPALEYCDNIVTINAKQQWDQCSHGTLLQLLCVDLSGAGENALDVLQIKLANFFALDSMTDRHIYIGIKSKAGEDVTFQPVKKRVAFRNMAYIAFSPGNNDFENRTFKGAAGFVQKIPHSKINAFFSHKIELYPWESTQASGEYTYKNSSGRTIKIPYVLKGWIGIHCTINKDGALNDKDFARNRFYNPNQLRLYVRNKLAVENFLNVLNNTQTYANYIEGEIHFDLLDDDLMPDIATANRQSVDEHDARVRLLCDLLQPIIRSLIKKRVDLAAKMKAEAQLQIDACKNAAKQVFTAELQDELSKCDGLSPEQKTELETLITNKIQGDVALKEDRVIFFSHSSWDKHFGDFFHELLLEKGVLPEEMFYTSRDDDPKSYEDVHPLADQIKKCIIKENTLLFYLIGYRYPHSQYCLFEGGAGWATRAVGQYPVLSIKHEYIPRFLTNDKNEMSLYDSHTKKICLERNNYQKIVAVLNRLLDHINKGRVAKGMKILDLFSTVPIPKKHVLKALKKKETDFMDPKILEFWDVYVKPNLCKYIRAMNRAASPQK